MSRTPNSTTTFPRTLITAGTAPAGAWSVERKMRGRRAAAHCRSRPESGMGLVPSGPADCQFESAATAAHSMGSRLPGLKPRMLLLWGGTPAAVAVEGPWSPRWPPLAGWVLGWIRKRAHHPRSPATPASRRLGERGDTGGHAAAARAGWPAVKSGVAWPTWPPPAG